MSGVGPRVLAGKAVNAGTAAVEKVTDVAQQGLVEGTDFAAGLQERIVEANLPDALEAKIDELRFAEITGKIANITFKKI